MLREIGEWRSLGEILELGSSPDERTKRGREMVANRLAEVLFIQEIRVHIASGAESCRPGWLRAIFDPQIGDS
jgi:hypothetical protein